MQRKQPQDSSDKAGSQEQDRYTEQEGADRQQEKRRKVNEEAAAPREDAQEVAGKVHGDAKQAITADCEQTPAEGLAGLGTSTGMGTGTRQSHILAAGDIVSLRQSRAAAVLAKADERIASSGEGFEHAEASAYAAYLQRPDVRQQMASLQPGSVLELPKTTLLMGEDAYGQQLYVRPCYVKLRCKLEQLAAETHTGVRDVIVSGTPGIGKSFCGLYLASLFISQGRRVIYEWHGKENSTAAIWYHFRPNTQQCYYTEASKDISPYIVNDHNTIYIVDGGLPRALSRSCWCYAFISPRKEVSRWSKKSPGARMLYLPVWELSELQHCRQLVAEFNQRLTQQSVEIAYQLAGGIPRTVLEYVAKSEQGSPDVEDLIVSKMQHAVASLHVQDLQDTTLQILQEGYHNASDLLFHLVPQPEDKVPKLQMPQVMYASKFAAQLVTHKLGAAARGHLLSWIESSAGSRPWRAARGHWFEMLAHQALSQGADLTFRLIGAQQMYTLHLPAAQHVTFTDIQTAAQRFKANSLNVYAQPSYHNHPSFDAVSSGNLWYQITVAKRHSEVVTGISALQRAGAPICDLNQHITPQLDDSRTPIHMIVTTPDRFETCYQKQKKSSKSFRTGVLMLDLRSAFANLRSGLDEAGLGLDNIGEEELSTETDPVLLL